MLKILLGVGRPLVGRLLLYDALDLTFRELKLRRDPACPLCGENPTVKELIDYEEFCGLGRGQEAPVPTGQDGQDVFPRQLHEWLERGDAVQIIDVREPHEAAICRIEGARLIPLGTLSQRLHEIDAAKMTVVHCKSGTRSARAVQLLRQAGLTRTYNLKGGIVAWAHDVDPSLPTY